jgi:hypothetical protein
VPFDVAFSLTNLERAAYAVVLGILDGHVFDWDKLKWSEIQGQV